MSNAKRARHRTSDVSDDASIDELIKRIDRARSRLAKFLRAQDAKALATRPPSGEWSAIENVRHLLFAEQLHFSTVLPGRVEWSRIGLSGRTGKAYADVGMEPSDDLEVVLKEWNGVHRAIRKGLKEAGDVERRPLYGNVKHLNFHFDIIKTVLEDVGG